jgi:hypothetical protein
MPYRDRPWPPRLLVAFSLPRKGASLRIHVWRKLQRYGSMPVGNSGYLLPNSSSNRKKFEWLAAVTRSNLRIVWEFNSAEPVMLPESSCTTLAPSNRKTSRQSANCLADAPPNSIELKARAGTPEIADSWLRASHSYV